MLDGLGANADELAALLKHLLRPRTEVFREINPYLLFWKQVVVVLDLLGVVTRVEIGAIDFACLGVPLVGAVILWPVGLPV